MIEFIGRTALCFFAYTVHLLKVGIRVIMSPHCVERDVIVHNSLRGNCFRNDIICGEFEVHESTLCGERCDRS